LIWLVAEDEADIRNLITMMVTVWGHEAVAFENGQKVWDWLDAIEAGDHSQPLPELVLMDIRMPGKKGSELAVRMRSLAAFEHTPIVLMTAFSLSDSEAQEMIDEHGVDHILRKPLPDFDQLRATLDAIVEARKRLTTGQDQTNEQHTSTTSA
jgi:CheY-like chemotaxis protein